MTGRRDASRIKLRLRLGRGRIRTVLVPACAAIGIATLAAPGARAQTQSAPCQPSAAATTPSSCPKTAASTVTVAKTTPAAKKAASTNAAVLSKLSLVAQLSQIPFFANQENRSTGALGQLENVDAGAAFGMLLAILQLSLWSYWAAGLLLSGSGGTEVLEALIKIVLSAFAIVLWPILFKDGVDAVNAVTAAIITAPFVHSSIAAFDAKLAGTVVVAGGTVATGIGAFGALHDLGSAVGITGGLSIASLLSTGNPVGWFLDLLIALVLLVGTLIIELERIALYATVTFAYVAGPLAAALTAFRGFQPITGAFFRITMAAALTVVVWTLLYVIMAILDTSIDPMLYAPGAWWSSIVNNLTAVMMVVLVIFTPGVVRRHVGGTGGGATGVMRSAAMIAGYRMLRGGGARRATTGAARAQWRQRMRGNGPTGLPTTVENGPAARPWTNPRPGPSGLPNTAAGRGPGAGPTGLPDTGGGDGPSGLPSTRPVSPGSRTRVGSASATAGPNGVPGARAPASGGPSGLPSTDGGDAGGPTGVPSSRSARPSDASAGVNPSPSGVPDPGGAAAGGPTGTPSTGSTSGSPATQPPSPSDPVMAPTLRHAGNGEFTPNGPPFIDAEIVGGDSLAAEPRVLPPPPRALPPVAVAQPSGADPRADERGAR